MATVSQIFAGVRVLLNDQAGGVFNDTFLLPVLNVIWGDLINELALHQAPIYTEETTTPLEVLANATSLTTPSDLISPVKLEERPNGGTDSQWVDVPKRNSIDYSDVPSESIKYWVWREFTITFIAPTTDREVLLTYRKTPAEFAGVNSIVLDPSYVTYLRYETAALLASSVLQNDQLAGFLAGKALAAKEKILGLVAHEKQSTPVRKRPFRAFR